MFPKLNRVLLPLVAAAVVVIGSHASQRASSPEAGEQLFKTYCASCHGLSGRGDGPLAPELRRTPADLTMFTQRNGGVFPTARVQRIIEGGDIPSHGNREMPVWGDVFTRAAAGDRQSAAERIKELTRFLESIQQRSAE